MGMFGDDIGTATLADGAAGLADAVSAAGWRIAADEALVRIVDARRAPLDPVEGDAALAGRTALLAVVTDAAAGDAAYAAGATHIAIDEAGLARALRFAGRYARRLRGIGRTRRADDNALVPESAVRRFLETDDPRSVAIVALTRFEVVNSAFGRATGDALLAAVQERIETVLAEGARGAALERGDGAHFTLALATDRMGIVAAAIEAALARQFEVEGSAINLGARIGVAHRGAGEPAVLLLRRADEALAKARASDSATIHVAEAPHDAFRLAADLHRAIDRGEIDVLFQPQVAMATGAIVGVEALARWEHPELGGLGADALFAAADRADLGIALSDHIQALALRRVAAWPVALAALRIAINVTAADIARADFAGQLLARIAASGVARARVTVEITETGLIGDLEAAAALLATVRGAGCRVAIDDFGTGYSSLAYLAALPLDYLKIDRRLTQDIDGSERDRIVVRGVIAMARSLGLETIAEGVETEAQRALLAAEGCTYYQGFLCAEPLDDAALAARVEAA